MAPGDRREAFHTTHWSVVRAAGQEDSGAAREALSYLCEWYWYPLYAYVRRSGCSAEDARDVTQAFFARLLEKKVVRAADPDRGRFRNFLLASLKNFLSNERARASALKRGGGETPLSLDFERAEGRFGVEPLEQLTPERVFERNWAREVIARAMVRLREDYERRGDGELFESVRGLLVGDEGTLPRAEIARQLGLGESALNVAIHRMRKRFRERLRREIGHTVADADTVQTEMSDLFDALGDEHV